MIPIISSADPAVFDHAYQVLQKGGTLIYPTETCYGLGCDSRNEAAVARVFSIKERDPGKPVLVIAHSVSMLREYVEWNETIEYLSETYWPGPLTIVSTIQRNSPFTLARGVVGSDETVAFRVTSHPFAAQLTEMLGAPIVSTSANISSHANPYDIGYMLSSFEGREHVPNMIIDAGNLPHHSPSTIVKVLRDGSIEIMRQGEIILDQTQKFT